MKHPPGDVFQRVGGQVPMKQEEKKREFFNIYSHLVFLHNMYHNTVCSLLNTKFSKASICDTSPFPAFYSLYSNSLIFNMRVKSHLCRYLKGDDTLPIYLKGFLLSSVEMLL